MDIFNVIVGIFSIIGTIASICAATYAVKIANSIKVDNSQSRKVKQTMKGNKGIQIGGDMDVRP